MSNKRHAACQHEAPRRKSVRDMSSLFSVVARSPRLHSGSCGCCLRGAASVALVICVAVCSVVGDSWTPKCPACCSSITCGWFFAVVSLKSSVSTASFHRVLPRGVPRSVPAQPPCRLLDPIKP